MTDFAVHRPGLLRHCYRMLGSYADAEDLVQDVLLRAWAARDSYAATAPVEHWLMRIATNACLNALAQRKRRALPNERPPSPGDAPLDTLEAAEWITPAPFDELELRESVALAFIALLQRLPPKQRAVLLLKDVVGWSADDIAAGLELTLGSVNSALHRARETITAPAPRSDEPRPDTLRAYLRSWEEHDVDGLVALLRDDITFAMPPFAQWFAGKRDFEQFLRSPVFTARWADGFRVVPTRANGCPALAFYHRGERSSIQVLRFDGDRVADIVAFIGAEQLRGFAVPERMPA